MNPVAPWLLSLAVGHGAPAAPPPGDGETTPASESDAPASPEGDGPGTDTVEPSPAPAGTPAPDASSASGPVSGRDPVLTGYLMQMKAGGMLDNREATLEEIEAILRRAQDRYVMGDSLGSAILLFEVGHNPRYETFAELPIMGAVDYSLGVALQSYGAEASAGAAQDRVLARGPEDPYFTPALRRRVDMALMSKEFQRGLTEIDRALRGESGQRPPLPDLDQDELDYLEARVLHRRKDYDAALAKYQAVDRKSRFYTASLYLQGVVHARRKQYREAENAFCQVVGGPNQSTAVYYVDQRYFPVRDLAHMGLGRVAHEEFRHGHAFYHYFQVPQESEQLSAALFEAAWTMAEEGEHAVARGLLAELRERFPDAPQTVEARVLDAMLMLYDCDFRAAETEFAKFIDEVAPVVDHIESIRADPARIRALHRELVSLRAGQRRDGDLPAHRLLLAMLDEDPRYGALVRRSDVMRREADFARAVDSELARLLDALTDRDTASARSTEGDALDALAKAESLERAVAGLERQIRELEAAGAAESDLAAEREKANALRQQVAEFKSDSVQALLQAPPIGSAQTANLAQLIEADRSRVRTRRAQALALAGDVDREAARVASARLGQLRFRVEDLLGEARMGRIDAVLGAKKKLEIEVRDMAAGKFPAELFGKLQIEGMVGDDEEFWPYQGEYWADEYEGYR